MVGASSVKAKACPVSLRFVPVVVPKKDEEKQHLVDDLTKMGCKEQLAEPWAMNNKPLPLAPTSFTSITVMNA